MPATDIHTFIETNRGRVRHVDDLSDPRTGSVYVAVHCGLDTPSDIAIQAAGFTNDDTVEASLGWTYSGGVRCGWVWTVQGYREGASSDLSTGCLATVGGAS